MSRNYLTLLIRWLYFITIIFALIYQKDVHSSSLPVTSTAAATVTVKCSVAETEKDGDNYDAYSYHDEDVKDSDASGAGLYENDSSRGIVCITGEIDTTTTILINPTISRSVSQSSTGKQEEQSIRTSRDNQIMTTTTPLSVNNASSTMQSQLATTTTSTLESTERTREVVSTMQSLTRQTLSNNIITPGSTSGSPAHSIMTQHHIIIRNSLVSSTTVDIIKHVPLVSTPKPTVTNPFQPDSKNRLSFREGYSKDEIALLVVVMFGSFILILSSFFILTFVVVRSRRKTADEMVVNVITVHNCSTGRGTNNESDRESVCERTTQSIEETSIDMASDVDKIILQDIPQCAMQVLDKTVSCDNETAKNDSQINNLKSATAPILMDYEPLVHAKTGEQVTLCLNFTGTPKPTITWTFKGNKMEGDYATELGTDGSLMFFCVESKHAGKYDFEITNYLGSAQGSVTLVVEEDDISTQNSKDVVEITNGFESNPIDQEKFGEYVAGLHYLNNKAFEIQYTSLLSGEEGKKLSVGKSDNYRCLNRFKNITAYDDCRVVLEPIIGHPDYQHDYINASYVDGFSQAKMFIATQGPLSHTIVDFWRLVWQEKVNVIAMVTNLREGMKVKCEQYWPEQGHNMQLGPYMVMTVEQQCFPYYIIRKFLLKCTAGIVGIEFSREIIQYHYTSWPDHGVPECPGPILDYLRRVKSGYTPDDGPILIHCSAGVGRTGTLMAIDIALSQASKERQVDIPKIIVNMRRQRMKMVQNANQYAFIHDAVLEALICGDTRIPASDLHQTIERLRQKDEENEGKTGFEKQFEVLEQVSPNPQEITRRAALMHSDKNRSNDFLPPDKSRVKLKGRSPGQDYIHASYIHSYKVKEGFIVAQSPMENTLVDFVKMLYERECGVVVMLCGCEEGGVEVCAQYWPEGEGTTLQHGEMLVSTEKETKTDGIIQRVITITDSKSDEREHEVTLLQVDQWNEEGVGQCSNAQTLIDVLNKIRDPEIQKSTGNKPVIVHGSDTVSRVGVFCSLVNAIEMCKTEGVVDVFQVVKALRIQKPGAVPTMNQYSFIFDLIPTFLESD